MIDGSVRSSAISVRFVPELRTDLVIYRGNRAAAGQRSLVVCADRRSAPRDPREACGRTRGSPTRTSSRCLRDRGSGLPTRSRGPLIYAIVGTACLRDRGDVRGHAVRRGEADAALFGSQQRRGEQAGVEPGGKVTYQLGWAAQFGVTAVQQRAEGAAAEQ